MCAIQDDRAARQPTDTLEVGPSRPPLFQSVPTRWREHAVAALALVIGLGAGAAVVLWWHAEPAPLRTYVDEHGVELLLLDAGPPRTDPSGRGSEVSPLQVDGAVFLSGEVTSTVVGIRNLDSSLDVRARGLPVTVSPTARLQPLELRIVVRDCGAATRWTPADRPFTIRWRDHYGKVHLDRAGDFDRSMAGSLIGYVDAACGSPLNR